MDTKKRFCVGTLSTGYGWETESPGAALAKHFHYWLISRRNQGIIMGKVPSFLYLFQQHGESKDTFPDHVKDALTDYLEEQFDKVLVGVNTSDIDGKESTYTLSISALVTVDGVPYNLAREVVINGSEFEIVNNKRTK